MISRTDKRRFYRLLTGVVFVAVSASSLIALLGRQFWAAELFTHFRLYYLLIQALLILLFLKSGHRTLIIMTIFLAVPNVWVVGPYLIPTNGGRGVTAATATGIDIAVLNVYYRNEEYSRLANYLREFDPDVIVISEFTPVWRDELEFLFQSHPFYLGEASPDPWGLAVFSRLPLAEAELIDLAQTGTVQARFVISVGSIPLEVFAVHLVQPTSPDRARNRNLQLEDLADRLRASKHRRLVIGDMNLTPFSPYFSRFKDRTGLLDARLVDGLHFTWPASALPIWIPIDHALADPEANVSRVSTGPDVGSDHLPLQIFVSAQEH